MKDVLFFLLGLSALTARVGNGVVIIPVSIPTSVGSLVVVHITIFIIVLICPVVLRHGCVGWLIIISILLTSAVQRGCAGCLRCDWAVGCRWSLCSLVLILMLILVTEI